MDKIKEIFENIKGKFTKEPKEGETDKRVRISKAQQQMMLATAGASIIFGICLVLSIHFIQYAIFYSKVLTEEDKSIANYEQSIINSGACADSNHDGSISDTELSACTPDTTPIVAGSLRGNVTLNMAANEDLESVARDHLSDCYDDNDRPINYTKLYEEATTEENRDLYLSLVKMCSALRVIPDALPAQRNEEALMASLNEIFILSDWQPESLSPGESATAADDSEALGSIPLTLSVEGGADVTMRVLHNIERSIRTFEPTRAMISWSSSGLSLQAQATSYYTNSQGLVEPIKTVNATERKKGSN